MNERQKKTCSSFYFALKTTKRGFYFLMKRKNASEPASIDWGKWLVGGVVPSCHKCVWVWVYRCGNTELTNHSPLMQTLSPQKKRKKRCGRGAEFFCLFSVFLLPCLVCVCVSGSKELYEPLFADAEALTEFFVVVFFFFFLPFPVLFCVGKDIF